MSLFRDWSWRPAQVGRGPIEALEPDRRSQELIVTNLFVKND